MSEAWVFADCPRYPDADDTGGVNAMICISAWQLGQRKAGL
jgi:hypothetical protein